jgi:hypothetical protein
MVDADGGHMVAVRPADPDVVGTAMQIDALAAALCEMIKQGADNITEHQARDIYRNIREAEGWLLSCRKLLEPPGVL